MLPPLLEKITSNILQAQKPNDPLEQKVLSRTKRIALLRYSPATRKKQVEIGFSNISTLTDDIQGAIFGTCFCLVTQLFGGMQHFCMAKGRAFELRLEFSFLDFADVLVPMFSVLGHS